MFLSCSLIGLTRAEILDRLEFIESFAELGEFFNEPVKTYRSGMYMRLGFSCAVAVNADIMLIDEILAVGDSNYQRKCLDKISEIRRAGTTFVIVSHDPNMVRQLADRALVLDNGRTVCDAPAMDALSAYADLMERKAFEAHPKPRSRGAASPERLQAQAGQGRQVRIRRAAVIAAKTGASASTRASLGS